MGACSSLRMAGDTYLSGHSPAAQQFQNHLSTGYSDIGTHAFLATAIRGRPFCLFLSSMERCCVRPKQSSICCMDEHRDNVCSRELWRDRLVLSHPFVSDARHFERNLPSFANKRSAGL
jgi:hypothetical protein